MSLTRLDRQRFVLGPLAHRAVIEGEVAVTELVEQEQVDGRRDAAAAIGDDALVFGDALGGKLLLCVGERDKSLGLRVEQRRRRHVDAAGNAAGPAVAARLQAPMEL